jgi:hypothetical protein
MLNTDRFQAELFLQQNSLEVSVVPQYDNRPKVVTELINGVTTATLVNNPAPSKSTIDTHEIYSGSIPVEWNDQQKPPAGASAIAAKVMEEDRLRLRSVAYWAGYKAGGNSHDAANGAAFAVEQAWRDSGVGQDLGRAASEAFLKAGGGEAGNAAAAAVVAAQRTSSLVAAMAATGTAAAMSALVAASKAQVDKPVITRAEFEVDSDWAWENSDGKPYVVVEWNRPTNVFIERTQLLLNGISIGDIASDSASSRFRIHGYEYCKKDPKNCRALPDPEKVQVVVYAENGTVSRSDIVPITGTPFLPERIRIEADWHWWKYGRAMTPWYMSYTTGEMVYAPQWNTNKFGQTVWVE